MRKKLFGEIIRGNTVFLVSIASNNYTIDHYYQIKQYYLQFDHYYQIKQYYIQFDHYYQINYLGITCSKIMSTDLDS